MISPKTGNFLARFVALFCTLAIGCGAESGLGAGIEEEAGTFEQPLGVGDFVSVQSYNIPDMYLRHKNFLGELTPVNSWLDRADATFKLVPGLANSNCVSFEASNIPGSYLRHQFLRIKLHPWSNDDLFKNDATFCIKPAIQPGAGTPWISFESYNIPGHYLRHRNLHFYLENQGGPFRVDATFRLVNPL
ncbi:AbfB domain-containing protein [Sorangium sp. So ce1182]|uniref:AbfB domain-containing protein n=1 Tax=Sorangium sp. So ce1182 TaxID=3133334 RepID=UPI003F5E849A